ncbi:hypothetical protein OSB04_010630 [Centaurea solstitialis]|uniref:Reverse transcriptase Ty1/copia-type domain-containing protein n=1 Tax=Centaurea solstitialis TaxID=347529 RepID=A0AA38TIQ8_9ASTR|nr:hypothetical protein OSB04_010630 [Centaurea solstitialis]
MKSFDMKDMGEANYVLGIEIIRNRQMRTLGLSQKGYIEKVLKIFGMENCKKGEAPISKGDKLHKGQCPNNPLERNEMDKIPYARLVGSLMYAQVCTRPDIAFAVNLLSRFQSNAGGAISWKANKQSLTATSTFQAEYIAIYDATSHAIWLKNFIAGLRIVSSIQRPLTMYCDNAAAVFFTKNNKRNSGSRNIDVKYFAVRENVRDKEIEVLKIGTKEQLADPFTKALPVEVFKKHVEAMGITDSLND